MLRGLDDALATLAEKALPAIVQINVSGYGPPEKQDGDSDGGIIERQRALGSGVIVDPSGFIMTNAHVVSGAQRIRVTVSPTLTELVPFKTSFQRKQHTYDAKLIGINRLIDLALIKIEERDLPFIPLNANYHVRLGQMVLAIGSPEGLEHSVTRGIVSAVGRQLDVDRPMLYIQTDAPINPGNSGGALIDRDGNLVGLNTFILTEGGGSEGLGFAIPEPVVRFAYQQFKEHGRIRRSEIGVTAQTVTPDLAEALHLGQDWGVIVSDVLPGGPAEKAGVKPKDIVTSVDGTPIDSLSKFTASLYLHPPDQLFHMEVLRGKDTTKIDVPAIDAPKGGVDRLADLMDPQKSLVAPLGVFLVDLDGTVAESLGPVRSSAGLVVVGRVDYAPRIDVDLQAGDIIRSINGVKLSHLDDLRTELTKYKIGDAVALEVERQGAFQFVTFETE